MGWPTAQDVVTQAALELGLIGSVTELGDDVYLSSDATVGQLLALLKKSGRDLVDAFEWEQLRAEWSIVTRAFVAGTHGPSIATPMPPDWRSMIAQSGWNRTTRLPLGGGLSEQEWQYLSSRLTGVVWTVLFRPMQGMLWIYPPSGAPVGQEITFGYKSSHWVRPSALEVGVDYMDWAIATAFNVGAIVVVNPIQGDPFTLHAYRCAQPGVSGANGPDSQLRATGVPVVSGSILDGTADEGARWNWLGSLSLTANALNVDGPRKPSFATKDQPESGEDVLLFDEQLLVAKLKLLWLKAKGFDSNDAEVEFQRQLLNATSNGVAPPILSLNGSGVASDRMLGGVNIPITGFGS